MCGAVDKCFCLFFSQAALPYFLSETGICVQSGKHTLAESSQDDLYCLQVSNQCTSDFRKMCLTDKKCVDQIKLEGSKRQPRIRIARTHQYEYRPLEWWWSGSCCCADESEISLRKLRWSLTQCSVVAVQETVITHTTPQWMWPNSLNSEVNNSHVKTDFDLKHPSNKNHNQQKVVNWEAFYIMFCWNK